MIELYRKFDISKANKVLEMYNQTRELQKAIFLNNLINIQKNMFPKSILYQNLKLQRTYPISLVQTVLSDLGYVLIDFITEITKSNQNEPNLEFSVICIGPIEG